VRQRWFQHDSSSALWGRYPAVVERHIREVELDVEGRLYGLIGCQI
jgi:hypothetical protein